MGGRIDENCDLDGDGYANINKTYVDKFWDWNRIEKTCSEYGKDCDDSRLNVNPGSNELCDDDLDNNCNGQTNERCICTTGKTTDCSKSGGVCAGYKLECDSTGKMPGCDYSTIMLSLLLA